MQKTMQVGNQPPFTFTLMARRSPARVGTRFFSRGIDTKGNVSNFVETEQILSAGGRVWSHVQIRGSIPLFWRQMVNTKYTPPINVLKMLSLRDVVGRHMDSLKSQYGKVIIFNLINSVGYEMRVGGLLTETMKDFTDASQDVKYTHFDFHKECKNMQWDRIQILLNMHDNDLIEQGFTAVSADGTVLRQQMSVVRINCMDCLDRTNVVQSEIGRKMLTQQLREAGVLSLKQIVIEVPIINDMFRNIWADHADALSMQYSGTGALKTDFTRTGKRSTQGALQDLTNSCIRYVKNNYFDGPRQDAYDILTGKYEISTSRGLPWTPPTSIRYYGILAVVVFSWIMILYTLIFASNRLSSASQILFWTVVLAASLRSIVHFGKEFVSMPYLINPYPDVLPAGILVK